MIEIRYKDIDPDTGDTVSDNLVAECMSLKLAEAMLPHIEEFEGGRVISQSGILYSW